MKALLLSVLLSTHALATEFVCKASLNGSEIISGKMEVTEEVTELNLGFYRDIELVGRVIMGQVSALLIADGIMYGTISMNSASYRMYLLGEGELQLDCGLN